MKRITDERLKMKNLKNIRILYGVLFSGIILILLYEGFTNGMSAVRQSPLWFLFLLNGILIALFSMPISTEVYDEKPMKYRTIILISLIAGLLSEGINYWTSEQTSFSLTNFLVTTLIFFFVFSISRIIIKKVRQD